MGQTGEGGAVAVAAHDFGGLLRRARLAVVEAMKMEHALSAPRAGRVEGLAAAVGATVEQGQRLMIVASEETAGG